MPRVVCAAGTSHLGGKRLGAYEEIRHTGGFFETAGVQRCMRNGIRCMARGRIRMKFAACEHRYTVALFTDIQYEMMIRAII